MNSKVKYLFIFSILFSIKAFTQPFIIRIKGSIKSSVLDKIIISSDGVKVSEPFFQNTIDLVKSSKGKFSGRLIIPTEGMYTIGDGYVGHQVFFDHTDSIFIELTQKWKTPPSNDPQALNTFHRMVIKGKYSGNYMYFDHINKFFGSTVTAFDRNHFNASKFKSACDLAYKKALSALDTFNKKGIVTPNFMTYASAELLSNYVLWICTPMAYFDKKIFPENYFEKIDTLKFTDLNKFERTKNYGDAAYVFNIYYLNNLNPDLWYSNFYNEFNTCKSYFAGIIRDKLMGWYIRDYKNKEYEKFDSVYNIFLNTCQTQSILVSVKKDFEEFQMEERAKPSFDSILMTTQLTLYSGKKVSLQNLLITKKLLLIDCWATWCKPCLKQIPFLEKKANKYRKDVEFIRVSFDEDYSTWKKFIDRESKDKGKEYNIVQSFKSDFAKYFNIQTIPRFILIDFSEKKKVRSEMPLPQSSGFDYYIINSINKL
jgi:thiol-disulfide isomerase/thioredoxin